ncbi:helix-turn-helix transcriptional regulator [Geminisphaera colitermitum]|uniref:helix-turn-helix transcriptional regulator n=1 Tax=Geminisphaera colitermitum TaxID=1148786 RepID=UPI000158D0F4|nr:hypothetical protein [Geminisphaera colitermitum]
MSDRLLSRKELAAALGRSRHYVHRMQQAGFAPAFAGRFTLADARAWLTAHPDFRATGKKITKRQKATRSDKKQHAPLHCPAPRELHPIRHAHDYVDFDYDAVEEAEGAAQQPDGGENFASLAHGLGEFCHMLTMPDLSAGTPHPKPPDARTVGLRTIAALWVLKPDALDGISMHQLSKRLGCTDTILSRYACQFRDRFGIAARGGRSEKTRSLMRKVHRAKANVEGITPPSDPSRN